MAAANHYSFEKIFRSNHKICDKDNNSPISSYTFCHLCIRVSWGGGHFLANLKITISPTICMGSDTDLWWVEYQWSYKLYDIFTHSITRCIKAAWLNTLYWWGSSPSEQSPISTGALLFSTRVKLYVIVSYWHQTFRIWSLSDYMIIWVFICVLIVNAVAWIVTSQITCMHWANVGPTYGCTCAQH